MKDNIQNDLSQKYSKGTRIIHWVTVLLILILFPLGKYMEGLAPEDKMGLIKLHAVLGAILFFLTIIRTWLFFKASRPANIKTDSKLNDKLAHWIHNIFYFLLFGITISGMLTMILGAYGDALIKGNHELIKDVSEIPTIEAHGAMALVIILLMLMHVAGVMKHRITKKENILKRIF